MDKTIDLSGSQGSGRVLSIDILRGLTMVLMIFVNDLWSLNNIPAWLEHVDRGVDGIGLADVVFPAFLFIVGLSLPFGIATRRKKGDTNIQLLLHVLSRTFALLVMGVFLVNGETINTEATGIPSSLYYSSVCLAFILIWSSVPKLSRNLKLSLRSLGILILLVLAFIYRGGDSQDIEYFSPQWWGILGLIGWAYLASGFITVLARDKVVIIFTSWLLFCTLSLVSSAGLFSSFLSFIPDAIRGGTLTGLTLGGALTAYIFLSYTKNSRHVKLTMILLGFSIVLILLSVVTRPYWGLAKLGATPAWLFLCSAFTVLTFLFVYWIADIWKRENWFNTVKPAGTDTLLCYLTPYFAYATTQAFHIHLPEFALTGMIGLLKSALFAFLCVGITWFINKCGVRLKL